MKRKIISSLLVLFLFSATGAVLATFQINNTTAELSRLIALHQINNFRLELIKHIQITQSDLYTMHTALGHELNMVVQNVNNMNLAADNCLGCHHSGKTASKIDRIQSLIKDYEFALSRYITSGANTTRIEKLKLHAASAGNKLLMHVEEMSFHAGKRLNVLTGEAMSKIEKARVVLYTTIVITFLLGILVAINLTRSVTHPIDTLLTATRIISSGELGYTIARSERSEFGELTDNFNAMSIALKEGYKKLHNEIDNKKRTEEELRKSEERFSLAARGTNEGLWDWDMLDNVMYYSPRWKSMLGYDDSDIGDKPGDWLDRVHPDDINQLEAKIKAHINDPSSHFQSEHRILNKKGLYRWVLSRGLAVQDESGKTYRMAGSQTDITEKKVAEEQLLHDAFHDALTGLPNRALFLNRLDHMMKSSSRQTHNPYAVMIIDLDRFKVINDSLGNLVGDEIITRLSERLVKCLRPGDTVARLGGDEFAILLENITEVKDTIQIAQRIQNTIPEPFNIKDHEISTTASIGIALSSEIHIEHDRILQNAEIAMYQAKAKGKAQYEVFNESMHEDIIDRLSLEADLRRALERDELVMHYQPIMDLERNAIIGFEALIRWSHPERGLIGPLDFIPLAEETGMIDEIGDWIIREACRQIKTWQKEYPSDPPLRISLNVSSKQFSQHALAESIATILKETALDPGSLTLEITESMIMEHAETAKSMLGKLRDLGVHIHVDDFGTGYSSLSYIHKFPVNALKIDRSFVNDMFSNRESLEIIRAIVALASNLNLDVVAEGLELNEQLTQIRGMKCQYGQGYLFSKPMEPEAISAWISREPRLSG